ncbi:MAG: ABC transporter ATP-binding protein [Enterococcus gilvus]
MTNTNILTVSNLKKDYSGEVNYSALKGINFTLKEKEFVAVMGPSGSGKTTFLNAISTIDKPSAGKVLVSGKDPYQLDDQGLSEFRRRELGFIFQDFNLVSTLTVKENILLPLTLDYVKQSTMIQRLKRVANFLNISPLLNKRTYEISGGQKQRVAIARAIIHQPRLLLADEPTGNLDSKAVNDVMDLFTAINQNMSTAMLMVTHDPYVASFAQRVIFMKDGELFNEIHQQNDRKKFYQEIMDTITYLGGGQRDF